MARRALNFATAHPVSDAGFTAILATLSADIDRADTLGVLQDGGGSRQRAATSHRMGVRRAMRNVQLRRLCRVASRGAADHPELDGKFVMPPSSGPNRNFLLRAQGLLEAATAQKDLLATLGVGDTLIAELARAVSDFEAATTEAHAARADHIGAGAELEVVAKRCVADVDVVDTYMKGAYGNDAQVLAAWQAARNITGPFQPKNDVPVPAPVVTPPAQLAAPRAPLAQEVEQA